MDDGLDRWVLSSVSPQASAMARSSAGPKSWMSRSSAKAQRPKRPRRFTPGIQWVVHGVGLQHGVMVAEALHLEHEVDLAATAVVQPRTRKSGR